jgi:hypothetical protein
LLARSLRRGLMGELPGREGFRKNVANPVSPTAVVFDDPVDDVVHCRDPRIFGFVGIAYGFAIARSGRLRLRPPAL